MSKPNKKTISLKGFKGINRSADPFDIEAIDCVDINNYRLDNVGVVRSGWGYSRASFPDGTEYRATGLTGNIIEMFSLTGGSTADTVYYLALTDDKKLWLYNATTLVWELKETFSYLDTDNYSLVRRSSAAVGLLTGNKENYIPYVIKSFADQFKNAYTGVDKAKLPITGEFGANTVSLPKPDADILLMTATDFGYGDTINTFYDGYYFFKVAFEYDGQWSLPSDNYESTWIGNNDAMQLCLTLPDTLDQRIKAVRIFRTKNTENIVTSEDTYRLLTEIRLDDDIQPADFLGAGSDEAVYFTGTLTEVTKTLAKTDCHTLFKIPNDKWNDMLVKVYNGSDVSDTNYIGVTRIADFASDTSVQLETLASAMVDGGTYTVTIAEGWFADSSNNQYVYHTYDLFNSDVSNAEEMYSNLGYTTTSNLARNPAVGIITANRQWIANFYDGYQTVKSVLEMSTISPDGVPEYDKYQGLQVDFSQYGATEILALQEWRNYLLVFTDAHLFQLRINTLDAITVQEAFNDVVITDRRSLLAIRDSVYFMSTNGPAVFRNGKVEYMTDIIDYDNYPMWGYDITNCVSTYDKYHDAWYLLFTNSAVIFCYRFGTGAWTRKTLRQSAKMFADFITDTPYFVSVRDLLMFDSSFTMNAVNAAQALETKQFRINGFMNMIKFQIVYSSDKAFTVKLVDSNGTTLQSYTVLQSTQKAFKEYFIKAGMILDSFSIKIESSGADIEIFSIDILVDMQRL